MQDKSFREIISSIQKKELSPVDLATFYLDRIERYNPTINGFVTVIPDEAIKQAKLAEEEISKGIYRGPLHGIPFAAKDIINTANIRTTNGSSKYDNFIPDQDAFCINKMKEAGAILIGKTNTHQYAAASTTINVHYGTTKNPHDLNKISGGSSGGSAAVVAANLVPIALGSDTGGSIRTPSSLCGIVGLKPTYGAISLRGVFPNSPSIDHMGPMCESVLSTPLT
jgi:aspartyl-tRNA(Asn)/glutamyl-tRNA(Gln) amidotransferase subunit A